MKMKRPAGYERLGAANAIGPRIDAALRVLPEGAGEWETIPFKQASPAAE